MQNSRERKADGTFTQIHQHFSLDNFDDYLVCRCRRHVYFPEHPRAHKNGTFGGYILRAIVAYEAYHNIIVPKGMDIHHKNGDVTDDSEANLQMLPHGEHSRISRLLRQRQYITKVCPHCKKEFVCYDKKPKTFCSLICYHKFGYSASHKQGISDSLKQTWRLPK